MVFNILLVCREPEFSVEGAFRNDTTIAEVKRIISNHMEMLRPGDLEILFEGRSQRDSTELTTVLPKKRLFQRKKRPVLEVRVSTPHLTQANTDSTTVRSSYSEDVVVVDTIESNSSSALVIDNVPHTIAEAFQRPSPEIVDELFRLCSGRVDRDILLSVYASCVEGSASPALAAKAFYDMMQDWGLYQHFENHDIVLEEMDDVMPPTNTESVSTSVDDKNVVNFKCDVCYEEYPASEMFNIMCGSGHSLCYECSENHLKAQIERGESEIQCFAPDCKYEMTMSEIGVALGHGDLRRGQRHPLYSRIDTGKLNAAIAKAPGDYCTCPEERCNWTAARSSTGAIERVTCGNCNHTFCANCNASYHYRSTCLERGQIRQAWQSWEVRGRPEYWGSNSAMARRARQAANKEKKRIEEVTKAEMLDEEWKARKCRHCPHCNRVVQKLLGCDIMRCGYDTDTRENIQDGCGQRFYWSKAKAYRAVKAGKYVKRASMKEELKPLHEGWSCDQCRKEIRGLRFECVNCPSFYICEKCDNSGRLHSPGHFFKIHNA